MANHNQHGGRNVALPEDNLPSWRPQDPELPEQRDRGEDERAERAWRSRGVRGDERRPGEREPRRWDAHGDLRDDEHRDPASRWGERYGQHFGGDRYGGDRAGGDRYGGDRYGDARWQPLRTRSGRDEVMPSPGSFEDRYREPGDEHITGRGSYWSDRAGGELATREGYRGRDFGPERRGLARDPEERVGYGGGVSGRGDERMGYATGSYGRGYGGSGATGTDTHVHTGTGPHRGKGPAGYQRSDERIREMVCESLTEDDQIDASHIEVAVSGGEVTLSGTVDDRRAKREAEDCAFSITGVRDVQNQLRVRDDRSAAQTGPGGAAAAGRHDAEMSMQDTRHRT